MRPLKITLQAFGSYLEKTEIDLTKFDKDGIYLITGKTGSGKTTIFDAIIFALFDSASGSTRDKTKRFRSGFATPDCETFVELEFENDNEIYKVRRNPEYMRKSLRGDGETLESPNSELFRKDGNDWILVCDKNKDVNPEIAKIIGLTKSQFSQMAMLPQGEFQKLLTAESKDRKEILENIFKTRKYFLIQEKIKSDFNALNNEIKLRNTEIKGILSSIMVDSKNPTNVMELNNVLSMEEYDFTLIKDLLDRLIKDDSELLNSNNIRKEELNTKVDSDKNLLNEVKNINAALEKLESLRKELISIVDNYNAEISKNNEVSSKKPLRDNLIAEMDSLSKLLNDYEELDKITNKLKLENEKNDLSSKRINELNNKLSKLEDKLIEINNDKDKLPNKIKEQANFVNENETLVSKKDKIAKIKEDIETYLEVEKNHKEETKDYSLIKNEFEESNKKYDELSTRFLEAQAGILAKDLRDGMKCPVCGSIHHPEKACLSSDVPTEKDVQLAKKEKEDKESKKNATLSKVTELYGKLEEKKKVIFSSAKDIFNKEYTDINIVKESCDLELPIVKNSISELLEKIDTLTNEIKELNTRINEIDGLNESIKETKESIEKEKENQKTIKSNIDLDTGSKNQIESRLKNYPKTKDDANSKISELQSKVKSIEDEIESSNNRLKVLSDEKASKSGQIAQLELDTNGKSYTEPKPIEDEISSSRDEINKIDNINNDISTRVTVNNKALSDINDSETEKEELKVKYGWLKELYDTATGQVSGKDRIDLSLYAVTEFFDHILYQANIRFEKMTSGQFTLVRGEEGEDGRKKTGLDIMVLDHYNGELRSVKTLSGGEIFKAALSFALGMSDEISNSTGIVVDSLFVDEGFGSLDEESIPQAINTLYELAAENRLIGIISHIDEVKQNIDKQIVVTKDERGISKVNIVC